MDADIIYTEEEAKSLFIGYKVWIQAEGISAHDEHSNISEPVDVRRFDNYADAVAFFGALKLTTMERGRIF